MNSLFTAIPSIYFWLMLILISSCNSCLFNDCPKVLTFQTPYSVSPMLDTFRIGDSILLDLKIPLTLTDTSNTLTEKFENYDFRIRLEWSQIDVDPLLEDVTNMFNLYPVTGETKEEIYNSFSVFYCFPEYKSDFYAFKAFMSFKRKGLFLITLEPYNTNRFPFYLPNTKCVINIDGVLTDPSQNNHFMLANAYSYTHTRKKPHETKGLYIFYVK